MNCLVDSDSCFCQKMIWPTLDTWKYFERQQQKMCSFIVLFAFLVLSQHFYSLGSFMTLSSFFFPFVWDVLKKNINKEKDVPFIGRDGQNEKCYSTTKFHVIRLCYMFGKLF